jgi:hypothetical protein
MFICSIPLVHVLIVIEDYSVAVQYNLVLSGLILSSLAPAHSPSPQSSRTPLVLVSLSRSPLGCPPNNFSYSPEDTLYWGKSNFPTNHYWASPSACACSQSENRENASKRRRLLRYSLTMAWGGCWLLLLAGPVASSAT